jgi:phage major tail protein, phi13 family
MLIGFKRAKIQPLAADGTPKGDLIVLEGAQGEGATQEATISGLSVEPVKVHGSNIAYYISQKGTGDVAAVCKFLDVPSEEENRIMGYVTDSTLKAQFIGENTEPPYCAIILESEDAKGNVAIFGFFKGKFSKGDTVLKTKEGGSFTPEGDTYTLAAVAADTEGKAKGNTMVKFLGTKEDAEAVEKLVLKIS